MTQLQVSVSVAGAPSAPTPIVNFVVTLGGGSVYAAAVSAYTNSAGTTAQNIWTLGTSAGQQRLEARLLNPVNGTPVTITPLVTTATALGASKVLISSGNKQTQVVGLAVGSAPTVLVTDKYNNVLQGVTVTFSVQPGNGGIVSPGGPNVLTDVKGLAALTGNSPSEGGWKLAPITGTNQLQAAVAGTDSVLFTATATAGPPVSISKISSDPQTAVAGTAVPVDPSIKLTDANGNVVPGIKVLFSLQAAGGTVAGATQTSDANGIATAGDWTLGPAVGTYALNATTQLPQPATQLSTQFTATATVGKAAVLKIISGDGQSAGVNTGVTVAPTVLVTDQNKNPAPGATVVFAVGAGGGSLTGGSVVSDANGQAAVGSWMLGTRTGTNTLSASVPGFTGAVTFTASAQAGAPTSIVKRKGDAQVAPVNTALTVAPSVAVTDQFGNAVAGATVNFAQTSVGGAITPLSATTDVTGVAALMSWTLGPVAGPNTVSATLAANTAATVTFTATGTGPSGLSITNSAGDAQTAPAGTALPIAPAVVVTDANGRGVAGIAVTFTVTAGSGAIVGATVLTDATGTATLGSWTLGTTPGTNELQASFNTGTSRGYTIFVATGT